MGDPTQFLKYLSLSLINFLSFFNLLNNVPKELNKMIAGNIQIDDIPNFINKDFIIDLSGALEDQNGKKDINKIDKLLNLFEKI